MRTADLCLEFRSIYLVACDLPQVHAGAAGGLAKFIFFAPPSFEELEARLRGRGTETEEKIALRLGNAAAEMEQVRLHWLHWVEQVEPHWLVMMVMAVMAVVMNL